MDKNYIIELLNNKDIKEVIGITIELELYSEDKIIIHYTDSDNKYKRIDKKKGDKVWKR